MADLNALIAQGAQFAKPVNPFEQYSQLQQLQANQLKVQEAQAAAEERNALRQLNPNSPDYEAQLFKVNPQLGIAYRKEAATTAAQKAAQAKSEFELKAKQREFGDAMKRNLSANPSDENVIAWGQDAVQQGIYAPEVVQAEVQSLLKMTPQDRAQLLRQSGATAGELKPQVHVGPSGAFTTPAFGGPATPVAGAESAFQMTPAQIEANKIARGQLAVSQGNLTLNQAKAAREADPAFQQQMAAAKATGEAIAKGNVAAKQALPKIISDAEMAVDLVDQMIGKQEVKDAKTGKVIQKATPPHPGFENAVGAGLGQRFISGTDAAGFQALQDQVEGVAFLSAFEALRGGGAISDAEGKKATAARIRMSLAQDEKSYIKAAREFQDVVRKGVEAARRKAGGAAPSTGAKFLGFE